MKLPIHRRALVALGLALATVVGAAAPAGALTQEDIIITSMDDGNPSTPHYAEIISQLFSDGTAVKAAYSVEKQGGWGNSNYWCAEVWTKLHTDAARPPDVRVTCRGDVYSESGTQGPLHYIAAFGGPGTALNFANDLYDNQIDVAICLTEPGAGATFVRGSNCSWTNGVTNYTGAPSWLTSIGLSGKSWTWLTSALSSNRPEYVGIVDVYRMPWGPTAGGAPTRSTMFPGDTVFSLDGAYALFMQYDGNLVFYRMSDGAVLWASNTNGNSGARLHHQTDGNLVLYKDPGTGCSGAACVLWSTGTDGDYLSYPIHNLQVKTNGTVQLYAQNGVGGTVVTLWQES